MNERVKLKSTNNYKLVKYEGCYGTLQPNKNGGWDFCMEKGGTISTSAVAPNTTLGNLSHPSCKEFSFQTKSGSVYVFDICNRERIVDGCFKKDNQFLGFDNDRDISDEF